MEKKKTNPLSVHHITFAKTIFTLVFKCSSCGSKEFYLKNTNPMLGLYCKKCEKFNPSYSPDIIFLNSNQDFFIFNTKTIPNDSKLYLKGK